MVVLFIDRSPRDFLPSDDTGQLMATTEGAEGISFDGHPAAPAESRRASCSRIPNVQSIMPSVGSQGSANQGRVFIILKPLGKGPDDRHLRADAVVSELMRKAQHGPGHHDVHPEPAVDPRSAAASPRASTSSRCMGRDLARARPGSARSSQARLQKHATSWWA